SVAGILAKLTPAPVVRVVELPDLPDGDIVNWIDAHGDAAEPDAMQAEIEALAQVVEPWRPDDAPPPRASQPEPPRNGDEAENSTGPEADLLRPDGKTDEANGRRVVARFGSRLHWCQPWGKWLVWDGRRWQRDESCEAESMAKQVARRLWDNLGLVAAGLT